MSKNVNVKLYILSLLKSLIKVIAFTMIIGRTEKIKIGTFTQNS